MAHAGDVEITVEVPGGEELARHTWNPRLGILGGISILGTTGVVHPYSCSAWIASIHRGIDVCRANGVEHAAACTGSTSEAAVQRLYGLPDHALIDMGDFAGGTLKYLRRHPIARLTIAGGFGKLSKLAGGAMDLHSGRSEVDREQLAGALLRLGGDPQLASGRAERQYGGRDPGNGASIGTCVGRSHRRRGARPGPRHGRRQGRGRGHRHRPRRRGGGACRILGALLILGGTGEARQLADALGRARGAHGHHLAGGAHRGTSAAGGRAPHRGFRRRRGADGLSALGLDRFGHRCDPSLCRRHQPPCGGGRGSDGRPLLRLERAAWQAEAGDHWIEVDSLAAAALAAPSVGRRAFLTIGVKELAAFAEVPELWFLVRLVAAPEAPLALALL